MGSDGCEPKTRNGKEDEQGRTNGSAAVERLSDRVAARCNSQARQGSLRELQSRGNPLQDHQGYPRWTEEWLLHCARGLQRYGSCLRLVFVHQGGESRTEAQS